MRYVCSICGYVYDEAQSPPWNTLSDDWKCPLCGAAKGAFRPEGTQQTAPIAAVSALPTDLRPLTAMELSAVCSNLARGCEKQYKADQAAAFMRLADWLRGRAEPIAIRPSMRCLTRSNRICPAATPPPMRFPAGPGIAAHCAAWSGARR